MPVSLPSVVLVGRPNVGKSTLFNRLTGTRRAIVTAIPGTTRDVIAQPAEWQGARFELVDTGGMFGASEDPLHALVLERGQRALQEADLLVLVVDGREGLVPGDRDIAQARRVRRTARSSSPSTRWTTSARKAGALEFYQLGIEPVFEVSAEHGAGRGRPAGCRDRSTCPRAPAGARSGRGSARTPTTSASTASTLTTADQPRPRCRWRSWAGRTPASRRWSIACCAKSG